MVCRTVDYSGSSFKPFEPEHSKPYKTTYAPNEDRDQPVQYDRLQVVKEPKVLQADSED